MFAYEMMEKNKKNNVSTQTIIFTELYIFVMEVYTSVSERFRLVELWNQQDIRQEEKKTNLFPNIMLIYAAGYTDLRVVCCMEPEFLSDTLTNLNRVL